jgi:hypothetical protein
MRFVYGDVRILIVSHEKRPRTFASAMQSVAAVELSPSGTFETCLQVPPMSVHVKVCGCRPGEGGAAHAGAVVRKPPMKETAGRVARWHVRRCGDFAAVSASTTFAIWHELCEWVKTPFAAPEHSKP